MHLHAALVSAGTFWLWSSVPTYAATTQIDLNDFFADPAVTVTVDGSLAVLNEDPLVTPVVLVNDPYLGDPNVIAPAPGRQLVFDYVFDEAVGNDDEFTAILFEATASGGPVFGVLESITIGMSQAGTVQFDLSTYVGFTLGLYFELFDVSFAGLESSAEISDLRLVDAAIPLPAGIWLLLSGIGALIAKRRR